MPKYTLRIFRNGAKVRQYSGTRLEVLVEFSRSIMSAQWEGCTIEWGTRRRVRDREVR